MTDDGRPPELYLRHRPALLKHVLGQPEAVKTLRRMLEEGKVPHVILISGPSGAGKTTLARIVRIKLGCGDTDFHELNAADDRGIDMARSIIKRVGLAPIAGKCRVWLIDEFHRATSDCASALLKIFEDTPRHAYFLLCTTDPQKLLPTIRTRCTEIVLKSLSQQDLTTILLDVGQKEGKEVGQELAHKIAEVADGSARKALVLLHQVLGLETDQERLEAVQKADTKRQAIDLARKLMDPRSRWADVATILRGLDEDAEAVRHLVLGYAASVVLGGGKMAGRGNLIIECFERPFYESKKPGLVSAAYHVMGSKS